MSALHIAIRSEPYGRWGFAIADGNGTKLAGRKGCASRRRAEDCARGAAERLIATDRALGRRSWVATGAIVREQSYAWRDPFDGAWRVGDRDSAGTHRPAQSRASAEYDASQANIRDFEEWEKW